MPSQYRENYWYYAGNNKVESIQFRGATKKEADEKFKAFLLEYNAKRHDTMLFKDFVEEKYKPTFLPKLSPTTQNSYTLYLNNYMIPYIGDKELGEITVEDIQHLFDILAKPDPERNRKALAHKSIERVSGLGRRLYRIATEMKLCDDTPFKMALLTIEGEESHHHKALPDEVVDRVKKAIPDLADPRERLYMGLLAYTGMRVEEIVGLRWENVFLDRHYGEVRRVVIYPDRKTPIVRDKTKTKHSTRDFIIPDALKDILEPLRQESGFIIHGRNPDEPCSFTTLRRTYRNAFKALGIYKLYNNHDWRATFGTQLKEANLSSAQVADLLGHADTRMVETVYAVTRHQGVMKHQNLLNALNPYSEEIINQSYTPANAQYLSVLADAFAPSVLQLPKNG